MFDDIDETFLQEVSVVEQEAARRFLGNARSNPVPRDASSERRQPSGPVVASARITQRSSFKRKRSDVLSSAPATPSKRLKGNRTKSGDIPETVDPHASARQVLSGIEEELSCPICMEVLATTYITNPCGHSCCGDCLLQWIDTSRKPGPTEHPKCPVCRTQLCRDRPAIRNVAMDSVARRYVSSAEEVGKVDWQPTGDRRRNFLTRSNHSAVLAGQFAQLPNTFPLTVEEDPDFAL
ncbi:RING/U-box, partial [Trametes versicolor FP-101664 SS1]|uniref:RING/U-box n=1 Tax=Trametes versicolor (strain FP-101664) TaxID=717944 RepID=UPI00046245FE